VGHEVSDDVVTRPKAMGHPAAYPVARSANACPCARGIVQMCECQTVTFDARQWMHSVHSAGVAWQPVLGTEAAPRVTGDMRIICFPKRVC